jgi:SAM-dependent methyltransferase
MKYYYPEHIKGYRRIKEEGKRSWGEIHGDPNDFELFSSRPFLERILPRLHFSSSSPSVLECGCGTGPGACFLAARGFQVDAIDLIPIAIEIAKQIAAERNLEIHYEVMDICELPHDGKQYDLIVDSFCLQGIVTDADRRKVFLAVQARLERDGYYLVSTAMRKEQHVSSEDPIFDASSGRLFHRYGRGSLIERDTGLVYKLLEGNSEEYDGTLKIGDLWYIHNRRHLTASMLRVDLEGAGFKVLYQDGELGENAVCVLPDTTVSLRSISEGQ